MSPQATDLFKVSTRCHEEAKIGPHFPLLPLSMMMH